MLGPHPVRQAVAHVDAEESKREAVTRAALNLSLCRPLRLPLEISLKLHETMQPLELGVCPAGAQGVSDRRWCWSAGAVTPQLKPLPAAQTHDSEQL